MYVCSASVVAPAPVPVAVDVSLLVNNGYPVRLSELKEPRFTLHYELDGGIQVRTRAVSLLGLCRVWIALLVAALQWNDVCVC